MRELRLWNMKPAHHSHSDELKNVSDAAVLWAVALNVLLAGFEVFGGVVSGSMAVMADALHNFNDGITLVITYVARRISRRPPNESFTFSYRRAELIGAMVNLTALILVGAYLVFEAVRRFIHPQPLGGGWMMAASALALVVDVGTTWLLWAMSKGSMNVRAAFVHNLADALAALGVLAGGAAVRFLGWDWVDPTLTILIAGYIMVLSLGLLRRTASILMEGAPEELDLHRLQREVEAVAGVTGMHHLHVWELDEAHRALEAHVCIRQESLSRLEEIKAAVKSMLHQRFSIGHSTLEIEVAGQSHPHPRSLIPRGI
jgi:cobalt-zinc-cadmium efflux system protein